MIDFVIGLGQGGCRVARLFSNELESPAAYFNLSAVDFSRFEAPRGSTFICDQGGTGRDPKYGEKTVRSNMRDVKSFLGDRSGFNESEYVLVCVGGGGGSGTGFLFPMIEYLTPKRKVLIIFTMPEKREGLPVKPNAFLTFDRLLRDHCRSDSEHKISLLVADNDYCVKKYGVDSRGYDYWKKVNGAIVSSIRRFWMLTNLEKYKNYVDTASGYKALDRNDVRSILFAGGLCDVREMTFQEPVADGVRSRIKSSSMLFGSLDISTTKRYAVAIGIPDDWKSVEGTLPFVESVFDTVSKTTKTPHAVRSSYFNRKIRRMKVHLLLSGLTESHSTQKIKKGIMKDIGKYKDQAETEGLDTSGLEDFT